MKLRACLVFTFLTLLLTLPSARAESRDGLLLEYSFEGNVLDSSGQGHDGVVHGAPGYVAGKVGQCLSLGGADWIDTGLMLPPLDAFTVECWVNPADTQVPWADVLGNHAGGGISGIVLQQQRDQINQFVFVYGSAAGHYVETKPFPLKPGTWQHVACVKGAGEARLYLNGVLVDVVKADGPMAASTIPLRVGLGFPGTDRCFNGKLDEVRVWSRALDDFGANLTEADQLDQLAALASTRDYVAVQWLTPKSIVTPGDKAEVELSLDPRFLPAAVTAADIAFDVADYAGRKLPSIPPLHLTRATGFSAGMSLPTQPGYYRITYTPTARGGDRTVALGSGEFSYAAMADSQPHNGAGQDHPATPGSPSSPVVLSLDGKDWRIATDPDNVGRQQHWEDAPVAETKAAKVPWIIQEPFPGYHGVAWYWRDFEAPVTPHPGGRYLLHFAQVDYLAEVWLNGTAVGGHEGGETPFELDVTDAIHPGAHNTLAVRVLNPTHERIDSIVLEETPHRCKVMPYRAGAMYNVGGITGSVELRALHVAWLQDLFVRPDAASGTVRIRAMVRNASKESLDGRLALSIAPAGAGEAFEEQNMERKLPPGDTVVETVFHVDSPHTWDLNDPYLYRATARVTAGDDGAMNERAARFGFRDFRFEKGYFRLNGRRLFLRSSHTVNNFPVGLQFPEDPDFARRDLLNAKVMGFNMIRFICGGATPEQLDLCDEIGLLVYEESYASWFEMVNTPKMKERFDRSVGELIERDRNHPSVVVWGLLNEIQDGLQFRHAVDSLPLVRYLDDSRMVMLSSGRWDGDPTIGTICNPESTVWEASLGDEGPNAEREHWSSEGGALGYFHHAGDAHSYLKVPQTAESTNFLRTVGSDTKHVYLSEYGIGSAVDLFRTVRHYERIGKTDLEDAQFYQDKLNRFLADWDRWDLGACFDRPEDFFAASLARMASNRRIGLDAIRSNPNLVGHNVTGLIDHVMGGEGLTTPFREMKPGAIDAMYECWAPLRLCLFAEPVSIYRSGHLKLEAVLANEDALQPGDYPIALKAVAPDGSKVLERTVTLTIPVPDASAEPPLALPVYAEDVTIDGPPGKYRFLASFQKGAAATGGETEFYITDGAAMPPVEGTVTLWGEDPELAQWLSAHGIATQPFAADGETNHDVILVGAAPPAGDHATAFKALMDRIETGATAIFLSPDVFAEGGNPVAWLPSGAKGAHTSLGSWLYLMDAWGKDHPIFDGLPSKGLLDYVYYRELIRDTVFAFEQPPAEAVAGGINAALDYRSGLLVSVHRQGAGRMILNTLLIRENLGTHPAAERLLRNMLRYAAGTGGA